MTSSQQPECPPLQRGHIIPAFSLPGADGVPHSPWDYKQRQHLLLLFPRSTTTSNGRGLLRTFAQHYRAFREEDCAILAITADPVITNLETEQALHLPFPLLADPQAKVMTCYTQWESTTHTVTPCIILADRYGALYEQWRDEDEAALPPIRELIEILEYLNRLCTP